MRLKLTRPSPAMVVACLALFAALGTGAYAAKIKLKPGSVKTKTIKGGAVTQSKIADGAVTTSKLGSSAVTGGKIADFAVNSTKIGPGSVSNGKIEAGAVSNGKIEDAAISASKIGPAAVTKAKFAASGTATNTTTYNLTGPAGCTLDNTFAAPGVLPGDVIAYSFSTTVPAGVLSAAPAEGTAGNNTISVEICENAGVLAAVTPGSLILHWIAIR